MKIAIISGSHRKDSESNRVGRYVEKEIQSLGAETYFFSLAENPLPFWDEGVWTGDEKWSQVWSPIATELQSSDGFVVIAPEWSGMVPAGLKNFFLLCSPAEVGHKPGLIVSVSSGVGGSYPINELRISSYKNTRLCYIPEHVIVRGAAEMLKTDAPANKRDEEVRARLGYGAKLLLEYAKAFQGIRNSGVIDHKSFPFGM